MSPKRKGKNRKQETRDLDQIIKQKSDPYLVDNH